MQSLSIGEREFVLGMSWHPVSKQDNLSEITKHLATRLGMECYVSIGNKSGSVIGLCDEDGVGQNSLASVVARGLETGMVAMELSDDRWWFCHVENGLVLPGGDELVSSVELVDLVEDNIDEYPFFANSVPDDCYEGNPVDLHVLTQSSNGSDTINTVNIASGNKSMYAIAFAVMISAGFIFLGSQEEETIVNPESQMRDHIPVVQDSGVKLEELYLAARKESMRVVAKQLAATNSDVILKQFGEWLATYPVETNGWMPKEFVVERKHDGFSFDVQWANTGAGNVNGLIEVIGDSANIEIGKRGDVVFQAIGVEPFDMEKLSHPEQTLQKAGKSSATLMSAVQSLSLDPILSPREPRLLVKVPGKLSRAMSREGVRVLFKRKEYEWQVSGNGIDSLISFANALEGVSTIILEKADYAAQDGIWTARGVLYESD